MGLFELVIQVNWQILNLKKVAREVLKCVLPKAKLHFSRISIHKIFLGLFPV